MRLIDADKLVTAMCEGCDMEACNGNGKDSVSKCYAVETIENQLEKRNDKFQRWIDWFRRKQV